MGQLKGLGIPNTFYQDRTPISARLPWLYRPVKYLKIRKHYWWDKGIIFNLVGVKGIKPIQAPKNISPF
jgi:hypothetical protein